MTGVNVYADGRSRFAPCEHFGAPETDLVPAEKARHVHQIDGSVVRLGAGVATYRIDQTKMEQYILAPEGKAV